MRGNLTQMQRIHACCQFWRDDFNHAARDYSNAANQVQAANLPLMHWATITCFWASLTADVLPESSLSGHHW
jgi:hypothetical protein